MDVMTIIYWIVVGALAGWIASMIMKTDEQMGAVANIVAGIVGAFVGGLLLSGLLGIKSTNALGQILTAIVGAIVVIAIWKAITGRRTV